MVACIIVSFLFHALVTTSSKCILPGRDVFFSLIAFPSFSRSSLLVPPSNVVHLFLSLSVTFPNHLSKEEKTSGNRIRRHTTLNLDPLF